jgi:hypothetical protein
MTALIVYGVGAIMAWIAVGAWQRAMLDGPRWREKRAHEASCRWCEPPGFFWVHGYSCSTGPRTDYPFSLSQWALVLSVLFWPAIPPVTGIRAAQRFVADRLAVRIELDHQTALDRQEIERLVSDP